MRRSFLYTILASALLASAPTPVLAQWTGAYGKISSTHLSHAGNFAFRVGLHNNGTDALSSCNHSFAFIDTGDDNYQAKVAALLAAAAQQQQVNLFYTKDGAGWCNIHDFTLVY